MTLFKSLVQSRLDSGSQLWSPHLVKHIDQKIQRSFTKHITRLHGLEYSERLVSLKLIRFKEDVNAIVSYMCGKWLRDWFPIFLNQLFVLIQSVEEDHALFHM